MRYGSRSAALVEALRALRSVFGGAGSMLALLVAILAVLAVGWFGDAVNRLLFDDGPAWWGALPLLALMLLAALPMRRLPSIVPVIEERLSRPARALVLFLSFTRLNLRSQQGTILDDDIPDDDPWQMPLIAIRRHFQAGTLEWIVVITSEDSGDVSNPRNLGTWRLLEDFRRVVSDVVGVPAERILTAPGYAHGVNFEGAADLWRVLGASLDLLRGKGMKDSEIVIDITGGQKLPAAMGGVAGLGEGLRLEYVSTRDKRVLEYDVTMRMSDEGD